MLISPSNTTVRTKRALAASFCRVAARRTPRAALAVSQGVNDPAALVAQPVESGPGVCAFLDIKVHLPDSSRLRPEFRYEDECRHGPQMDAPSYLPYGGLRFEVSDFDPSYGYVWGHVYTRGRS